LKHTRVEYLEWAKRAKVRGAEVSLLDSGMDTPHSRLDLKLDEVLGTDLPLLGDRKVREGIASRYGIPSQEVLPVLGTSLGVFLAVASTLQIGDVALVETPTYESLWKVPEAVGARVMRFSREMKNGWAVDPDSVLAAWEEGTRLVVVSDLHNPSGRWVGDDALGALAGEVEERGAFLLVDEVYRDFRPGPPGTARALGGTVIAVSSLTKVYGLGGLRAGWILGPAEVVRRAEQLLNLVHVVDPGPLQAFFRRGLAVADELRAEALVRAGEGWERVAAWCRGRDWPRITPPHGGIHAWAALPPGTNGSEVAERLLEDHGVAVIPGRFFGDDSGIRLGFGAEPKALAAGLDALARVL
jgi:aspartate/methionine/tyrosine aminotransferase